MNCHEASREILVADLDALRSDGDSPLAAHLSSCDDCRRRAATIAGGSAALARAVVERRRIARARVMWLTAVPIAAAIVGVLVMSKRESLERRPTFATGSAPPVRHVSVDVAPGQRATVLKTADPNVTLIWLSPGVGQ